MTRSSALGVAPAEELDVAGLPVSVLPGAGPATSARLEAAGLRTVGDLLAFVPRAYDDLRTFTPIASLVRTRAPAGSARARDAVDGGADGPAEAAAEDSVEGTVVLVRGTIVRVSSFPGRFLAVQLEDGTGRITARWFRVPGGMARAFDKGKVVALAGPLRLDKNGQPELHHPTNVTATLGATAGAAGGGAGAPAGQSPLGIRARYPLIQGVAGRLLERIVRAALDAYGDRLPDPLPAAVRERLGVPALGEALRAIHRPDTDATPELLDALVTGQSDAHRRLAVEDLLVIQVGLARRRAVTRERPGRPCALTAPEEVNRRVREALPFTLTGAQVRAVDEIARDLAAPEPMQRLLVGDVGSGKTAVAFAAAAHVAAAGGQTLLMAPTEILAEQHARTLARFAERAGLRVGLLTASTPRPQRETLLALARAGQVAILVGTQALLAERVALRDLRLAIVDEQHRFGVADRARLAERDDAGTGTVPHLLVMTATPIPRTLAFTLYGDLDLSLLDEVPPGRVPVRTRVLSGPGAQREAEAAIAAAVAAGRRAFVVCPVREISAREGGVTAVDRHRELEAALRPARVGLVHGALDARAREAALRAFAAGRCDVLVATTVIEVGIDVPEASLMVIEEADRFGLAQLHQLRGRVGRGGQASDCLLLHAAGEAGSARAAEADPRDISAARARLELLASTSDGFAIAEADLRQRGCGDLFGVRQSGVPRIRFADLAGTRQILELARAEAGRILAEDPALARPEHLPLRRAVEVRWAAAPIFGEEAG